MGQCKFMSRILECIWNLPAQLLKKLLCACICVSALCWLGLVTLAFAAPNRPSELFSYNDTIAKDHLSGFALDGFDPIDYFMHGQAIAGIAAHESIWRGAAWRFSSAANKAAFDANPELYAPQFGGYDAFMVAAGKPVEASPFIFWINESKIYFFRTQENLSTFKQQYERRKQAHAKWADVKKMLNAL